MAPDQDEQRREAIDFLLKTALITLVKQEIPDEEDERHRHPLVHGEDVMRARLHDDRMGLLIREEFGRQLLDEAIEVVHDAEE